MPQLTHLVGHGMRAQSLLWILPTSENQPRHKSKIEGTSLYSNVRHLVYQGNSVSNGRILPCARVNIAALDSDSFIGRIKRAAAVLIAAEAEITRQDVIAGDGDAGLTLQSGAKGVLASVFSCSGV